VGLSDVLIRQLKPPETLSPSPLRGSHNGSASGTYLELPNPSLLLLAVLVSDR
jgi:hypothetical protein